MKKYFLSTKHLNEQFKEIGISLPKGQMTHAMRHSFANLYIKNGGDILELRRLLGHSTINMTMRYTHLAPGTLDKVIKPSI